MAELLLKVGSVRPGDHRTPQDGDIVCAFNSRRIRYCHAEQICHVRKEGFAPNGRRIPGGLAQMWYEKTRQYKFERVSRKELKRILLVDMSEEILSDIPNEKGEAIHLEEFIARRLRHPEHRIFGPPGAEYWYGGHTYGDHAHLDNVWAEIESRTAHREVDYRYWPVTPTEKRHYLVISVDDFDEDTATDLPAHDVVIGGAARGGDLIVKAHKHRVAFRALVNSPDIDRKDIEVDVRNIDAPFQRSMVVERKP